ncbi:MAG: exonuclease domain-containing protein [Solirubrobacterales bacterium]|jgi:exodeoxyribonuclease X
MGAVIFDTETTGSAQPKLIEAAGIIFDHGTEALDLRPTVHFHERFNPGEPSTFGALATHHILDEEAKQFPLAETFDLPGWFVRPEDFEYLIGHNVDYDWEVIGKPEVKRICTLALFRRFWPQLDSHSLGAVAYFVLGQVEARQMLKGKAHGAVADCEVTRHILARCIKAVKASGFPATWEGLWQCSEWARVPTHFPFGKHKGEAMEALPKDYVQWCLRNLTDIDSYLRTALERQL